MAASGMSKQKTFWGRLTRHRVRHLWHGFQTLTGGRSACGLVTTEAQKRHDQGPKCKRCLRAIAK